MARAQWSSRPAFVLAGVGAAALPAAVLVPAAVGRHGGAYLVLFAAALVLVGLPVLLAEASLGKMAQRSVLRVFASGRRRGIAIGAAALVAALLVAGVAAGATGAALRLFGERLGDGTAPGRWLGTRPGPLLLLGAGAALAAAFATSARGVRRGLQRAHLVALPLLVLLLGAAAVVAAVQGSGYAALRVEAEGFTLPLAGTAVLHALLCLALGVGVQLTFGAALRRQQPIGEDGVYVVGGALLVALLATLAVVPVAAPDGPAAVPAPREGLPYGGVLGAFPAALDGLGGASATALGLLVAGALALAGFLTLLSLLEVPVSVLKGEFAVPRWKGALLGALGAYLVALPMTLQPAWATAGLLLAAHFLVLPGAAATALYVAWWTPGVAKEIDRGLRSRVGVYVVWTLRLVTPALVAAAFVVTGLLGEAGGLWHEDAAWRRLADAVRTGLRR